MDLFNKKMILFVCLGNICRSPAAEGILKHMADQKGMSEKVFIDSAGIGGWHVGQLPDRRMIACGRKNGYEFNSKARKFSVKDFQRFDYIIVMDEDNYRDVRNLASSEQDMQKVHYISEYFNLYRHYSLVPDPYYGDESDFQLAIDLLEDACNTIMDKIIMP